MAQAAPDLCTTGSTRIPGGPWVALLGGHSAAPTDIRAGLAKAVYRAVSHVRDAPHPTEPEILLRHATHIHRVCGGCRSFLLARPLHVVVEKHRDGRWAIACGLLHLCSFADRLHGLMSAFGEDFAVQWDALAQGDDNGLDSRALEVKGLLRWLVSGIGNLPQAASEVAAPDPGMGPGRSQDVPVDPAFGDAARQVFGPEAFVTRETLRDPDAPSGPFDVWSVHARGDYSTLFAQLRRLRTEHGAVCGRALKRTDVLDVEPIE